MKLKNSDSTKRTESGGLKKITVSDKFLETQNKAVSQDAAKILKTEF